MRISTAPIRNASLSTFDSAVYGDICNEGNSVICAWALQPSAEYRLAAIAGMSASL